MSLGWRRIRVKAAKAAGHAGRALVREKPRGNATCLQTYPRVLGESQASHRLTERIARTVAWNLSAGQKLKVT